MDKPSFTPVRVMNTGIAAIRAADFEAPLRLDFGGRQVVDVEVIEADRVLRWMRRRQAVAARRQRRPGTAEGSAQPKHRIKLLVLLSGDPDPEVRPSVSCEAFVAGGRVFTTPRRAAGRVAARCG
ncbi:hypothetical protein AB0A74_38905 [Saccharothrix sp. NPDC042600]|uniref:hypothetical protein n=1 Tax=Saccharothrix TaxID=2071 RepID=UPI0033CF2152